ncbi:MAG: hypothetical protein ABIT36_02525 [Steroidobacteraceae bacterium]
MNLRILFSAFILLPGLIAAAEPPARNALLGTWEADISKSSFIGRLPYRTGKMVVSKDKAGLVRVVADVVTASGAPFHFEYASKEDGTVAPVIGNPYYDSQSTLWADSHTAIRTEMRAGKATGVTTMVVARDGKSYKASASRTAPEDGHQYTSVIVWNRVK